MTVPEGLAPGGARLWSAVMNAHHLDAVQRVILLEACRTKDRLDRLCSGEPWALIGSARLVVDADLHTQTAQKLKQLLASLRLRDRHGRRAQRRGTNRGVYRKL